MKPLKLTLLFIFSAGLSSLFAYDWPIQEDTVQHVLTSVMGECREARDHFHRGIDINAPCSTRAYTIEGDTCYKDTIAPIRGINIGHFRYYHMVIRYFITDSSWVGADSFFAKTDGENHVHLQEADRRLRAPGDLNYVRWLNSLRIGGIYPYVDSARSAYPQIRNGPAGIGFWQDGTNNRVAGILDGRIDISVDARDPWTDSLGCGMNGGTLGNMGMHRCYGYIFDTLRIDTLKFEYHRYDTCAIDRMITYAYAPGSSNSRHIYWITNNPFDTINPRRYYWNTKQKINEPDSVDADSIEVAKFKDCYYWVLVKAYDIRGNLDVESLRVMVDNFPPKIRETDPVNGATNVPVNKKVKITFNETMDQTVYLRDAITFSPGVSGSWSWPAPSQCEFTPDPAFRRSTTYTVTVSTQMRDKSRKNMAAPYIFSFTTSDTVGGGTGSQAYGLYPVRFQWESAEPAGWTDFEFSDYFYQTYTYYLYGIELYDFYAVETGNIWPDYPWLDPHFHLPTAGGRAWGVIASYNDSIRIHFGRPLKGRGRGIEKNGTNPRKVVEWLYTKGTDTTNFEVVIFPVYPGIFRYDYRKCDIETLWNDGGSGISAGDQVPPHRYIQLPPVYTLAGSSFLFTTEPPPGKPVDATAYHASPVVKLTWRANPEPDLKGYNVYRKELGMVFYQRINPIILTTPTYSDTNIISGRTYIYAVTALDTFNLESAYSDSVVVRIIPTGTNNFYATAFGKKLARSPNGRLHRVWADIDKVFYQLSDDQGTTWTSPTFIGQGEYPTISVSRDGNPSVVYGRWITDPSDSTKGWQKLYVTRFTGLSWTTPVELFTTERISRPVEELVVPKPFAGIDSDNIVSLIWVAHYRGNRFADWFGRFYLYSPYFHYLDTLFTQEHPEKPCHALVVDDSNRVHLVSEKWAVGASEVYYQCYERDSLSAPVVVCSLAMYPYLDWYPCPNNLLLVWDAGGPPYNLHIKFRQKQIPNPWQDTLTVCKSSPWRWFPFPTISAWYSAWGDSNIYFSRFNGNSWGPKDTIATTLTNARFPQTLFHQDATDTLLFVCYTEGKIPPYRVEFRKRIVPRVPLFYTDCGESIQSPYCLRRKGYLKFGPEAYKTVDYDNKCLSYQFKLNPDKDYRIDLSYYFSLRDTDVEFPKSEIFDAHEGSLEAESLSIYPSPYPSPTKGEGIQHQSTVTGISADKDSTYTLVQLLKIDGLPLDLSYVKSHELKQVSVFIPESLYADGKINVDIDKVKRRYVVCGEIGIYEFDRGKKRETASGVQEGDALTMSYKLFFGPVYPNPTKGIAKIRYGLNRPIRVKIAAYDVSGRLVCRITNKVEPPGFYEVIWDAKALPQGVYFVRFETDGLQKTNKVVLVK